MRTVEVAVVGAGAVAASHLRDLVGLAGRVRVAAAVDTDPDRLAGFAAEWGVPRRYPSLGALLDAERPDLVDLCTPPWLHREQLLDCLRGGLTVLCGQPPALSLADLHAVGAAEEAGAGRFAAMFPHRFGSGAQSLRRLVGDPRLGRPLAAVCNTLWYRPDEYFAVPWRGRWELATAGPATGHGVHQVDLLLSVLGDWQEVVAVAGRPAWRPGAQPDAEDVATAVVTFTSGAVATVVNSLVAPPETSYFRFDFEHATVELEHRYGYTDADWTVTPTPGHAAAVAAAWQEGPKGRPSGPGAQFVAVLDALSAGQPPPMRAADARATLELVAAGYASAFTRRPVARGEIGPDSPWYQRMDGTGAPWAAPAGAGVRRTGGRR